ncbi:MAG: hypothetical protein GY811_04935 [Myxococcales bacterium]|nr:hypothetical protein [Myxococcales bacterium]
MPAFRLFRLWALLATIGACGSSPRIAPEAPTPESLEVTDDVRLRLTIPPGPKSQEAMRSLMDLSDRGHVEASWLRAHYLLELFDSARFGRDVQSRDFLAEISGRPKAAMTGPVATQAIAELLILETDRTLELDRQHGLAQKLRVIAGYDASGPTARSQAFQAMQELKRVRVADAPLTASASLRLFGYCRSALTDAQALSRQGRRIAISHCLYPLFDADPEPYFSKRSALRPPPPELERLLGQMQATLRVQSPGRLRGALEIQSRWLEDFSGSAVHFSSLDPLALRLPPASRVAPYDDYPLYIPGTTSMEGAKAAATADGRHRIALALAADAPASGILSAAVAFAGTDVDVLSLLVAIRQRLRAPKGDYWYTSVDEHQAWRAGELPISLGAMRVGERTLRDSTSEAKATEWNRRHSQLSLHLVIAPRRWSLLSPLGEIASFAANDKDTSPAQGLRAALRGLRRAFPDEQGLVLVAAEGLSVGAFVMAANAVRYGADGAPLFPKIAIAQKAPKPRSGKALRERITRRAAAAVSVVPTSLEAKIPSALRCYQALAEKKRLPTGEVRLEMKPEGALSASGGHKAIQSCSIESFEGLMRELGLPAIKVDFSVKAK